MKKQTFKFACLFLLIIVCVLSLFMNIVVGPAYYKEKDRNDSLQALLDTCWGRERIKWIREN